MSAIAQTVPHLTELVPDLLENMLFSEAELIDDVFDWSDAGAYYSEIDILSPVSVRLRIAVPKNLARDFAMALSPTAKADDSAIVDLIGELSNTLAGRLGAALCDAGQSVNLGLPTTRLGPHGSPACEHIHQTYNVSDGMFGVAIAPVP